MNDVSVVHVYTNVGNTATAREEIHIKCTCNGATTNYGQVSLFSDESVVTCAWLY